MRRRSALLPALLLGVALVGPSCSAGDDDASSSDSGESAGDDGGTDTASEGGGGSGEEGAPRALQARSLIRTAEVSMVVDDVREAAGSATALATEAGGFQSGGSLSLTDPPSGFVEIRVPAAEFEEVVAAIGELGEVADQAVSVEDVTEAVVDLDSRVRAAEVSVERVRSFLSQTGNVAELATVESELTARETQLETLRAQQRALAEQVDLATITARFGEEDPPPLLAEPAPSDDIPGFLRALKYGWVGVVSVAQVVAAALGFALPFVLVGAPVWLVWRGVQRRRRRAPAAG